MLLIIYQIFSSLLGNLPFLVQFFLHFYGVTFFGTPNTIGKIAFLTRLPLHSAKAHAACDDMKENKFCL